MVILEEIERVIQDATRHAGPAVVGIGRGWGVGSGVVIAPGRVLTNAHNLRHDEIAVTFDDGRRAAGTIAGADADLDIAVINVDTADVVPLDWPAAAPPPPDAPPPGANPPTAVPSPPDAPPPGANPPAAVPSPPDAPPPGANPPDAPPPPGRFVVALGNPGGRGLRVTPGFVSGAPRSFRGPRGRQIAGAIEHTAPLPRGSSGGPLLDADGRLLGINTVRVDGGLILAITLDRAMRERIDALGRGEASRRPRLGIVIVPPRAARKLRHAVGLPDREGIMVRAVEDDSPASRAGLQRGDLIVAAAGTPTDRTDALYEALDAAAGAGEIELVLVRGTDERTVSARF